MGGCYSRSQYEENRTDSNEIPEPVVLKEKHFAFVNYTRTKTPYERLEDVLLGIPDSVVSEISLFQLLSSEYMSKTKNVLRITGIDPISSKVRAVLLVEKYRRDVLVQFGKKKVMDLILESENAQFLFKKEFNHSNGQVKCSDIVRFLQGMNKCIKGVTTEKNSVITYIKTILR